MRTVSTRAPVRKVILWLILGIVLIGGLYDFMESNVHNTPPTIKSLITNSTVDDATVECMAPRQAQDMSEYWTLDAQNLICKLKKVKWEIVPSESAVSDGKLCCHGGSCKTNWTMLLCIGDYRYLPKTIRGELCSDRITVQVLAGNYDRWH